MFVEIGYTNDDGQNKWSSATSFDCSSEEHGMLIGTRWAKEFLQAAAEKGITSTIDYVEVSK